jgi:hypothetical protein
MCQVGAVWASWMDSKPKLPRDRNWSEYPPGTKAHAYNGGAWLKLESGGWQWNGHTSSPGSTFPTPGADAFGRCVELPANVRANLPAEVCGDWPRKDNDGQGL